MADDPTDPADDEQSAVDTSATASDEVDDLDEGVGDEETENDDVENGAPAKEEAAPAPKVVRKKVTSKRVTPKGATQGAKVSSTPVSTSSRKAEAVDDDDASYSKRYTPPKSTYAQGPSPWWVPTLMFGLLVVGGLIIMLNYMELFGEPANLRLVLGLGFILGGIITATQYR